MNIQPSELWCDCMEAVEKIGSDGDYAHTNTQNTEMVYSLCSPSVVYVWPEPSHVWQTAFGRWTDCTRFAERSTYYSLVIKKNIQTIKFGVHLSVESRQIKWFSACKYTILSWVPKRNWQRTVSLCELSTSNKPPIELGSNDWVKSKQRTMTGW